MCWSWRRCGCRSAASPTGVRVPQPVRILLERDERFWTARSRSGSTGRGRRMNWPGRRPCADDTRIAAALERSAEFGVAEYLAAGPKLLTIWRDGWAPGTHPRGAAIVAGAVAARRAGFF